MKLTVTLKDKSHPFAVAERLMRSLARSRASRMARIPERMAAQLALFSPSDVQRAVGASPPPFSQDDLSRLIQSLTDEMAAETQIDVDEHTQGIFALGVHLAQEGEEAIQSPNTNASSALRASVVDRAAYQWARLYTYHEIRSKQVEQIASFVPVFLRGIEQGSSPLDVARKMGKEAEGTRPEDWITIARTESARVLQVGLNDEAERLGVEYLWVPRSPRCCERCKELVDGRVFRLADIAGASNYGRKSADWIPSLPVHPNCLHFGVPASQRRISEAQAKIDDTSSFPPEGVPL